jgi:N-acetylglucosaminyldiphosphoundecaprenol N-acetyl-beta-D-mannosaminyltransferase
MNAPRFDTHSVLGVAITDLSMGDAIGLLTSLIERRDGRSRSIFYVNTHTLNTACDDPDFRAVLNRANYVFGDGTGVRWATRILHAAPLKDNVNGTDLTPRLFASTAWRGYRYYLLGNKPERIARAARYTQQHFSGWSLAGFHHGYVTKADDAAICEQINAAAPHMLLVGMGNPLQERWIDRNLERLQVPVCMAIGGLFDYWSGDLERAAPWVRAIGYEWLHLVVHQPHKARRYFIGNPKFLARVFVDRAVSK